MFTTPNLGRLTPVPVREVWPHEARDFTPWLLDNVDVLSKLLGIDLVLEVAEHPVGSFSLDLLGRDPSGSRVIVENQLSPSDHGHLGQILTYAAGTEPATIVWITTGFRPEHRAALDWLNQRTEPEVNFFGVEIEVVRIGDSIPAPNFKLVAQPNDWETQVKSATTAGGMTEKSKLYWDFWEQFLSRVIAEHPGWTNRKTSTPDSWYSLPAGTSVASLESTFTRKGLAVQLFFGGPDPTVNTARFEALRAKHDQFEQALGEDAVWDEMTGRKSARVSVTSEFADIGNIDQWPSMVDWLLDQHARFRRAIQAVGGLGART
jgi:hypothetical protein